MALLSSLEDARVTRFIITSKHVRKTRLKIEVLMVTLPFIRLSSNDKYLKSIQYKSG